MMCNCMVISTPIQPPNTQILIILENTEKYFVKIFNKKRFIYITSQQVRDLNCCAGWITEG